MAQFTVLGDSSIKNNCICTPYRPFMCTSNACYFISCTYIRDTFVTHCYNIHIAHPCFPHKQSQDCPDPCFAHEQFQNCPDPIHMVCTTNHGSRICTGQPMIANPCFAHNRIHFIVVTPYDYITITAMHFY